VIKGPTHHWEKYTGTIPENSVKASEHYYVARGHFNNEWIPGKFHGTDRKAYVPWGGKENEVHGDVELCVAGAGTKVEWVPTKDGHIVDYTVGPMGTDNLYIGRALCPAPENVYTPGKIHPVNKRFYLPWGGKEVEHEAYECLVIKH